jgi:predicted nucleic acid-binding protein
VSESDLKRICLDTNVYIIGTQDPDSDEAQILRAIGYYGKEQIQLEAEIILSPELIDQVRRVGKYLWNKDKAGFVLGIIWSRLNIYYVTPNEQWRNLLQEIINAGNIPTEDIEVFLTALLGDADCFISSNRELIKAIANFECLTPHDFLTKYLKS